MKTCSKCKETKPLSEFSKSRREKDGHCSWCKSCVKAYKQSEKGKAACRKADAKYYQTPYGKVAIRKRSAEYQKTPNGKATMKRFSDRHPNQAKAHSAVSGAIRYGRLPRANTRFCHYCPNPAQQYHHWHGYEPECWLDVVPVCVECHTKIHKEINYE